MGSKINQLLQQWPPGKVATLRWLNTRGIDRRLADKYVQSGWMERLGHGAYKRAGASGLRGYTHYLSLGARAVVLFGNPGTKLPAWFEAHAWSRPVTLVTTGVFAGTEMTTSTVPVDEVDLEVATLERAALEMMYLVPKRQSFEEAYQVMESLTSLRPKVVQHLLEGCTSVKTKRLFMHAAERANHSWLKHLDLSKVDFGSGRRTIHAGGRLNKKYDLVVADPAQS